MDQTKDNVNAYFDISNAKQNLLDQIVRAREDGDTLSTGFLLQKLADLEAWEGHTDQAHALHEEAARLDPNNPLPLLLYAKGLLRAFGRPDLALAKLDELEELLGSGSWLPGDDEPPKAYYENEVAELRRRIEAQS